MTNVCCLEKYDHTHCFSNCVVLIILLVKFLYRCHQQRARQIFYLIFNNNLYLEINSQLTQSLLLTKQLSIFWTLCFCSSFLFFYLKTFLINQKLTKITKSAQIICEYIGSFCSTFFTRRKQSQ